MAHAKVIRDGEFDWRQPGADWAGRAAAEEPQVWFKMIMSREPGLPNVQRVRFEPKHFEPPHTHDEDEVIFLIGGELTFGDRTLGSGDTLFVPKNTRYSLRAGEAGAEFVRVGLPV